MNAVQVMVGRDMGVQVLVADHQQGDQQGGEKGDG